jgi:hypothetical protein
MLQQEQPAVAAEVTAKYCFGVPDSFWWLLLYRHLCLSAIWFCSLGAWA